MMVLMFCSSKEYVLNNDHTEMKCDQLAGLTTLHPKIWLSAAGEEIKNPAKSATPLIQAASTLLLEFLMYNLSLIHS